jgi:predicted permease
MKHNIAKGLTAIGFAILIYYVSQYVSVMNCQGCTPCSGWDMINPICQIEYQKCVQASAICSAESLVISQIFLGFAILLFFYGVFRIVW